MENFGNLYKTQEGTILGHMLIHGSITEREAFRKYNITCTAQRIYDLRKLGFCIRTEKIFFSYPSPTVAVSALCLLLLHLRGKPGRHDALIQKLSSAALGVFLLHTTVYGWLLAPHTALLSPLPAPWGALNALFSTLPVREMAEAIREAGIPAEISYSAGTYVCNDLFYLVLDHLEDSGVPAGFIHVPADGELTAAQLATGLEAAISVLGQRV